MRKGKIHISNLTVRLPHDMAGDAKAVAAGIGKTLMRTIADSAKGKTGSFKIDKISAGKFSAAIGAGEIQRRVGKNAASAVGKKIGGGGR